MKRIIEIDEKDYNLVYDLISGVEPEFCRDRVYKAIVNGTPVAEGDWVMFSLLMTTIADKGLPFEEVLLLIDNAKTPTKDDCINREALKKKIRKYTEPSSKLSDDFSIGMTECACEILDMIDNAPTVSFAISPDFVTKLQNHNKELIKQLEEVERPQGECISREALKNAINSTDFDFGDYYDNTEEIRKRVCEAIDNAPTVEPICPYLSDNEIKQPCLNSPCERPQGEWKIVEGFDNDEYYECSNCGEPWVLYAGTPEENNMNFCPNCGADMRGE